MPTKIKCPNCSGCTEDRWVENNHYFYCQFCNNYYVHNTGRLEISFPMAKIEKEVSLYSFEGGIYTVEQNLKDGLGRPYTLTATYHFDHQEGDVYIYKLFSTESRPVEDD